MNLILLFPSDFIKESSRARLKGRRFKHIKEVHKVKVGQELIVGLENGPIGRGKVVNLSADVMEMDVRLDAESPDPLALNLVLAFPRPIMLKRILFSCAVLGVKEIHIIHSKRVEKSFWKSSLLDPAQIRGQFILGLEQAKDTLMPQIAFHRKFKPFVEDRLPEIIKETLPLVAHPESLKRCPSDVKQAVTLAIGPEGGFIPFEIDAFKAIGFQSIHLGARILRVETAVVALISRLF